MVYNQPDEPDELYENSYRVVRELLYRSAQYRGLFGELPEPPAWA